MLSQQHRYCEYRRPLWPWEWARVWAARRRNRRPVADGRDYVGWSARLRARDMSRPADSMGKIVGSRVQCGELVHTIDFDGWLVTTPLPWRYVELIPPAR
ncbi:MAG: hypothetical protein ACRDTG_26210 [Pseudonocardiaceae bacterium]